MGDAELANTWEFHREESVHTRTHTHNMVRGEADGRNLLEECVSFGGPAHAGLIGSVYWNAEPSADGRGRTALRS